MVRPLIRRAVRACLTVGMFGWLASTPLPLWAQMSAPGCTPDTATKLQQLALGLEPDAGLPDTATAFAVQVARQVATFVDPPARLSVDKLRGPSDWRDGETSHHSAGLLSIGQLVLVLGPNGRVREAALDPGTGSPEVDRALLAGVAAADSGGVFPPAPAPGDPRRIRLWILTAVKPAPSWATPVFGIAGRVPANATPAAVVSEPSPDYPAALLGTGRMGEVYVAFDVDEAGSVSDGSFRVLRTDDSAFVTPALTAIRAGHYAAATQGGCPIRMTLRQRIRFHQSDGGERSAGVATAGTAGTSASTARWIADSLPRYTRVSALVRMDNLTAGAGFSGMMGGSDIVPVHLTVPRAELKACNLTVTQRFEMEPSSPGTMLEVATTVPLAHADPRTLGVERRPTQSSTRASTLEGNAWHVLLGMRDGAMHIEYRQGGRAAGSGPDSWLDLPVPDPRAGAAIVGVIGQALRECGPLSGS
jgi:TonB family protein